MQRIVLFLLLACGAGQAMAEADPAPPTRIITLEVVIAELGPEAADDAAIKTGPADRVLPQVRELEEQGKFNVLTRVNLSTLEQQQARVQFGEQRAVVTGRTRLAGRPRDDAFGSSTYSMQSIGTLVSATARAEDDGSVIAELTIEKSGFAPLPAGTQSPSPEDDVPRPPRHTTMMVQSTVRIPAGQAVVVGGIETSSTSQGESGQVVILVTAQVSEHTVDRPAEAAVTMLRVFALRNAEAKSAADVLARVFVDDAMQVAADERTNSVLVRAPRARCDEIEAILQRLDEDR